MDIVDDDEFRVLGAFRAYRVAILLVKTYHVKVMYDARRTSSFRATDSSSPIKHVYKILGYLRDNVEDIGLTCDISYCIDIISSGKLYSTSTFKPKYKVAGKSVDVSSNESTNSNIIKRDSFEVRKSIQNKLASYDIDQDLGLTDRAKDVLGKVQAYDFDIFALQKETNGNEMVALTTYLLHKHDMFVNLAIDPDTFNRFITTIQNGYYDVAYHNKTHGADVGRLSYYYATN